MEPILASESGGNRDVTAERGTVRTAYTVNRMAQWYNRNRPYRNSDNLARIILTTLLPGTYC